MDRWATKRPSTIHIQQSTIALLKERRKYRIAPQVQPGPVDEAVGPDPRETAVADVHAGLTFHAREPLVGPLLQVRLPLGALGVDLHAHLIDRLVVLHLGRRNDAIDSEGHLLGG